jgi:hypothetical protein
LEKSSLFQFSKVGVQPRLFDPPHQPGAILLLQALVDLVTVQRAWA